MVRRIKLTFNADFLELSIPQKHRPVVLFQTDADWLIFLILVKLWSNLSNNLVVGSKTTNIVMGRLIIMAKPKSNATVGVISLIFWPENTLYMIAL